MPHSDPVPSFQSQGTLRTCMRNLQSLLTIRRASLGLAGTLVFAGTAAAISTASSPTTPKSNEQNLVSSPASAKTAQPDDESAQTPNNASSRTSVSATTSGDNTEVHVNVNGQDIPVASNGTTNATSTTNDGNTTVHTSTNISNQGSAGNTSSTSFSLNVNSSSTASGGNTQGGQ